MMNRRIGGVRISVKVKSCAKEEKVEKISDTGYAVSVKAKPQDGKANYALRELLARHFDTPRSRVILVKGERSKNKVFEIL